MSEGYHIEFVEEPDEEMKEAVYLPLRTHNQRSNPVFWAEREKAENDPKPMNLFALSDEGVVLAGLLGSTQFSWLKIEIMATVESERGRGLGAALLERAEQLARERGCKYAHVETMDFQAPEFYKKAGYDVFGELKDSDSHGHSKFFLNKEL